MRKISLVITTNKSGLVIILANPWLVASLDGLIYNPTKNAPQGIVGLRNPSSIRNDSLYEAAVAKRVFCLDLDLATKKLSLKQNHDYFYQVQCTMYTYCTLYP